LIILAQVGRIIGRGGSTIRELEMKSGVRVQVDHAMAGDFKSVKITGPQPAVEHCKVLVAQVLDGGGELGGAGGGHGGSMSGAVAAGGGEHTTNVIECPPGIVGRVIGRGGETIRGLQNGSGAHIDVDQVRMSQCHR
jgi:far upstream element-binding protein